jgi:hypothetical protein
MAVSDLANWWDDQKRESEKILGEWVQDNPQWWAVAIAGAVATSMELGAGFVDVLRFGEGAAQGGWKGYGKDALRLLMLLGPLARAGGAASRFLTPLLKAGNLRLAVQVAGVDGPCTFQAVNNAVSIMKGKNVFVTVADMAAGVGKRLTELTKAASGDYQLAAWIDELVPTLRQLGVRVREVSGFTQVQQVIGLAQKESGPVIFAIRTTVRNAAGATEEILHSVIAMRTPAGAVRFADYGGKFVASLPELVSQWGTPISEIKLLQSGSSATVIEGARLTGEYATKLAKGAVVVLEGLAAIQTNENGVEMAVPASVVASSAPTLDAPVAPEVIKGSFEAYKSRVKGRPVVRLPEVVITAGRKTAPRPDWLTGVQYRLNALGFGAGPVDGIMGPRTKKAVIAFQRVYPPLAVDGIPGPKTQAKLCEVCGY